MQVHLSRDSINMGDDVWAPHPLSIEYGVAPALQTLLMSIVNERYLPSAGGELTWVVWAADGPGVAKQPLAVLTSSGTAIRYLIEPTVKVDAGSLHLSCEGVRSPGDVAAELLAD